MNEYVEYDVTYVYIEYNLVFKRYGILLCVFLWTDGY